MRISIIIVCAFLLVSCNSLASNTTNASNDSVVVAVAGEVVTIEEQVVLYLNDQNYQGVLDMCSDEVKQSIEIGTDYFELSLNDLGMIEDFNVENNIMTIFGKIHQVKIEYTKDQEIITTFTFMNDVKKFDIALVKEKLVSQYLKDYKTLITDRNFHHSQVDFMDNTIEDETLIKHLDRAFELQAFGMNNIDYEIDIEHLTVRSYTDAKVLDLIFEYNNQIEIKNIRFPRIEAMQLAGLAYSDSKFEFSDFYLNVDELHPDFVSENESHYFSAMDLSLYFYNEINMDRPLNAYAMLKNEITSIMNLEEFSEYVDLMMKRFNLELEISKFSRTLVELNYNNPFFITNRYLLTNQEDMSLIFVTEVDLDVTAVGQLSDFDVIENIYIRARPTRKDVYQVENQPLADRDKRYKNCYALIDALKTSNIESLNSLVQDRLSYQEKLRLYQLQEKIVTSFSGVYIRKSSKLLNDGSDYRVVEYAFMTEAGQFNKLIIELNNHEEIINYNIAKVFTQEAINAVTN